MTWLHTHTGRVFDLESPDPEMIDIEDVALALSHLCRFFERRRPGDKRPREAIGVTRAWCRGRATIEHVNAAVDESYACAARAARDALEAGRRTRKKQDGEHEGRTA